MPGEKDKNEMRLKILFPPEKRPYNLPLLLGKAIPKEGSSVIKFLSVFIMD
jgi:hypothetical protein